jgi:hypothetical protein
LDVLCRKSNGKSDGNGNGNGNGNGESDGDGDGGTNGEGDGIVGPALAGKLLICFADRSHALRGNAAQNAPRSAVAAAFDPCAR